MKKQYIVPAAIILVLVLGVSAFALFKKSTSLSPESIQALQESSNIALAQYIKPNILSVDKGTEVYIKKADTQEYIKFSKQQELSQGDTVRVGKNSEATIHWMDDSISHLNSDTELTILEIQVNDADPSATKIKFDLSVGEVWSKAMNIVNDEASFSVQAGNVVVGIRGTTMNIKKRNTLVIQAIEHAVFILEANFNIPEGKQVTTSSNSNQNTNGSNNMQLEDIDLESYGSDWFKNSENLTASMRLQIQTQFLEDLKKLNSFNFDQSSPEVKNAMQLLSDVLQHLSNAMKAFMEDDVAHGLLELDMYKKKLQELKKALEKIDNEEFISWIHRQIAIRHRIILRYMYSFQTHNDNLLDLLEESAREDITPEQEKEYNEIFARQRFFAWYETMNNAHTKEEMEKLLQQYNSLLEELSKDGFHDYECMLLSNIQQKLEKENISKPQLLECVSDNSQQNTNNNTTTENRNVNSSNTRNNANKNSATTQNIQANQNTSKTIATVQGETLIANLAKLNCSDTGAPNTLKSIIFQAGDLEATEKEKVLTAAKQISQKCIAALKTQMEYNQTEIENLRIKLSALTPDLFTSEIKISFDQDIQVLQAKMMQLKQSLDIWLSISI